MNQKNQNCRYTQFPHRNEIAIHLVLDTGYAYRLRIFNIFFGRENLMYTKVYITVAWQYKESNENGENT